MIKRNLVLGLLIIIVAVGGYWLWQRTIRPTLVVVENLQSEVTEQKSTLKTLQTELQQQQQSLVKNSAWQATIIVYLIRMADVALITAGDLKTALAYLATAKQYTNDDPEFSALNHAINRDLADLQAVATVDAEALILRIDAVLKQINTLPLIPQTVAEKHLAKSDVIQTTSRVKRFWDSTKSALRDLVIIRHQAVEPLPGPEQGAIIRLNLQTKLLQAEAAVLQKSNQLYRDSLQQAAKWIETYFVLNTAASNSILQALHELQSIDLQPKIPALGSTQVLQELIKPTATDANKATNQSSSSPTQAPRLL